MLDHVHAQLAGGLEELVDDLTVGASLDPLPDERGRRRSLPRASPNRSSSIRASPVALGHPRKGPLDMDLERIQASPRCIRESQLRTSGSSGRTS
jgi:hypothetical protein